MTQPPASDVPAGAPPPGLAGYSLDMVRDHMAAIPQFPVPDGFAMKPMRLEDGSLWVDIWRDAEPYFRIADDTFTREFGADPELIARRCFILYAPDGASAGTISAWFTPAYRDGKDYGRIHWLAVRRAYQGLGLGKALMTFAMNELARWHDRAMLNTQSKRLNAVRIYLNFGFEPNLELPGAPAVWQDVASKLGLGRD